MESPEVVLRELATVAAEHAPRMFAVYGVYRDDIPGGSDDQFVSWGLDFEELGKAVLWHPDGSILRSDSADGVLRLSRFGADAHLIWLT